MLRLVVGLCVVVLLGEGGAARVRKQDPEDGFIAETGAKHYKNYNRSLNPINFGLWPSVFNLATKALISSNATCGEGGREEFCRLNNEHGKGRCGVCDNFSTDPGKKHPISYAIDGTNKWWQSPALFYGSEFEYVTITIDLKQVYQITHVIIKSATSPRPGTWVLERSLDDLTYEPWQYFARSDKECLERFGIAATKGKPHYFTDSEIICTSFYSRLQPLENGEIHTSLVHGRPGAAERSPEILQFTKARHVRIRLLGMNEPRGFSSSDLTKDKRLYYTIRDINIGGHCVCNGHGENCRHNVASGHPECECGHHTCGPNCDRCCPMFNQRQWGAGTSRDARQCLPCNCHGHAKACHYEEEVDRAGLSMDVHGNYQGGGVCDNCANFTTGINCEICLPGYYRPPTSSLTAPCLPCPCTTPSSLGTCSPTGACDCLPHFAGPTCAACAPGHGSPPLCAPCLCDPAGTASSSCSPSCTCKPHATGPHCDRCTPGHFALAAANPLGCTACYCSDVTTLCDSTTPPLSPVSTLADWLLTDLTLTATVRPSYDDKGLFAAGNYELPNVESLYWLAPPPYTGNKLAHYAQNFTFKLHWVIMRGDTSGKPTIGPDLILIGTNGLKIAHGDERYLSSNASFSVTLHEPTWYFLPPDLTDIVTDMKHTSEPVNRRQFLSVLADLRAILVRATFHTDQIEALLEEATLGGLPRANLVEKCTCPTGYAGLSCESCAFGYVRIVANSTVGGVREAFCGKCDCNSHSASCNADTGECFCEHNTAGESCERCKAGFYGNPLRGGVEDCRRCACPLAVDGNNFSPSCQLDLLGAGEGGEEGFVCTQCPKGYTGDHCEVCDDGFFGEPMVVGSNCSRCNCNGGPCDRVTGQCVGCKGNTEGWRCERCKPGYYGDASTSNCISCQCDPIGSKSKQCNNATGQCECKERFTGPHCDKCEPGYGNVTGLCTPCACDPLGAKTTVCDPQTGLCECREGVEGFHCDACQNLHFGFSENGCKPCECDVDGSQFPTCDPQGNCICKDHFTGVNCNRCEDYYYKENKQCVPCNCDRNGSATLHCNATNGQCTCKKGVGGLKCNSCKEHHYGDVNTACKQCEPCNKEGHVCDAENGKCVCPKLTEGATCEKCVKNAWSYEPGIGCQACNCSQNGSSSLQCDVYGKCACRSGFEGKYCDRCDAHKYYGYPNCRECKCNAAGTWPDHCTNDECSCTEAGCKCRANVEGKRCDRCKIGTFGLDSTNLHGCTECFCFGRAKQCTRSEFRWDLVRTNKFIDEPCPNGDFCRTFPDKFHGDLTLSNGGLLRIEAKSSHLYTVFITGNEITIAANITKQIQMTETAWRLYDDPKLKLPRKCQQTLLKACFFAVLQNVTKVQMMLDKGEAGDLEEVLLDKATNSSLLVRQAAIEQCQCPPTYTSPSCQDPNEGFYRYFPSVDESSNEIDRIIGVARPCECNGRSTACNKETGSCLDCANFTKGHNCELCDDGYYKASSGDCAPCRCPSAERNFALSCAPTAGDDFRCECRPGYAGEKCAECADGYWGGAAGGGCAPCACNPHGSESRVCDKQSGVCECRRGFGGKRCGECTSPRQVIQNGVCTPCDECTQILFNTIDALGADLNSTFDLFKDGIGPPWPVLNETLQHVRFLAHDFDNNIRKSHHIIKTHNVTKMEHRLDRMKKDLNSNRKQIESLETEASRQENASKETHEAIVAISGEISELIKSLNNFGRSHVDAHAALEEAKRILNAIYERSAQIPTVGDYERFFEACHKLTADINAIYLNRELDPAEIRAELHDLKDRLSKLNALLDHTEGSSKLTRNKNKQNAARISNLAILIQDINNQTAARTEEVGNIALKLNATHNILVEIHAIYRNLSRINQTKLNGRLNEKNDEGDVELYDVIDAVVEHVTNLQNQIKYYNSLVNFTKDEWIKINGSGAYENLVKGIQEARESAQKAEEIGIETLRALNPILGDTLIDSTNIAKAFSDRLEKRVLNLKNLTSQIGRVRKEIETLNYDIKYNGRDNNDLIAVLGNMKEQVALQDFDGLHKVIGSVNDVIENVTSISKNITDISKSNELLKMYQKYLNLTSNNEIGRLLDNITLAHLQLNNLNLNDTLMDKIKKLNADKLDNKDSNLKRVRNLFDNLKNKISMANNAADTIKLGISLSGCTRTYNISHINPLVSLSIDFICNKTCNLFLLEQNREPMINITARGKTIHVRWRNESVTFPYTNNNPTRLDLLKSVDGVMVALGDGGAKTERFIPDAKLMLLLDHSHFKIGGQMAQGKSCMRSIEINGNRVGLWRFLKSKGECRGCVTTTPTTELRETFYNGVGYNNVTEVVNLNAGEFGLKFTLTTFDENSLIFMAKDKSGANCSYIFVGLKHGRLAFKVLHTDDVSKVFESRQKYNGGKPISIVIKMTFKAGLQHYSFNVENGGVRETFNGNRTIERSNLFRIRKSDIFIGGVSPNFDRRCIREDLTSFLGYLNGNEEYKNSAKIKAFGTSQTNEPLRFGKALFGGNGELKLKPSVPLSEIANFSFILKSKSRELNAYLLNINNVDLFIKDRKLVMSKLRNDASQTVEIAETLTEIAIIRLSMQHNRIYLFLNERLNVSLSTLPSKPNKLTELDLGQDPKGLLPNFSGVILQISINNKPVLLDATTVQSFTNVSIGRDQFFSEAVLNKPKSLEIGAITDNSIRDMQNTEGCTFIGNYETDPEAVKFGDKENSFIYVENNFWKRDYALQFKFRAFYPNGLLFIAIGNNEHYNVLEIYEGRLRLKIKGKRMKKIELPDKINDGEWHSVQINQTGQKRKRKLAIMLDGRINRSMKTPKNNIKGEIYFGGIPEQFPNLVDLKSQIVQFRGCMSALKINNLPQVLIKNKKNVVYNNIGQCFRHVEKGAYFAGDAYAVYKSNFRVSKILELSFEFRTVEQNGILLSVSNAGNSPALSVELQNGAVVMTIDMGNGAVSNVTNSLDSDFTLCNNRWHNITALYSSFELTVNVDGIRKSWVQSDVNSLMDEIDAPLYVGGIPDDAPSGTLKIKESFKGCIRNLKVEENIMDWTDMKDLHNVLLNACPVQVN